MEWVGNIKFEKTKQKLKRFEYLLQSLYRYIVSCEWLASVYPASPPCSSSHKDNENTFECCQRRVTQNPDQLTMVPPKMPFRCF